MKYSRDLQMPHSMMSFRMTLSDLAKCSMTWSIALRLRQLSFLFFLRVDTAVHGLLRAERRGDGGYCRLRLAPVASRDIWRALEADSHRSVPTQSWLHDEHQPHAHRRQTGVSWLLQTPLLYLSVWCLQTQLLQEGAVRFRWNLHGVSRCGLKGWGMSMGLSCQLGEVIWIGGYGPLQKFELSSNVVSYELF